MIITNIAGSESIVRIILMQKLTMEKELENKVFSKDNFIHSKFPEDEGSIFTFTDAWFSLDNILDVFNMIGAKRGLLRVRLDGQLYVI